AALDGVLHVLEHGAEALVRLLAAQDVEALDERQAGVDHRGEEAREGDEIPRADAGAEAELRPAAFLRHPHRRELLLAEALIDNLFVVRLHRPALDLAGPAAGFPGKLCHAEASSETASRTYPSEDSGPRVLRSKDARLKCAIPSSTESPSASSAKAPLRPPA